MVSIKVSLFTSSLFNRSPSCLHTGLLVDIFNDYKYLFFMCGAVIVTGGLFLFVMNIYNYHMLEKEKAAKDRKQNPKNLENQDQTSISVSEMQETCKSSNRANWAWG